MKVNIGTYSFGGIASYLGLGPTLLDKFKTIASLGFTGVELLPVDLDNDIEDIKKWLKETGLEVVSIHAEPTEEIVKKIAELGGKAVIWAGTPFCNKAEAVEVAHKLDEMARCRAPARDRLPATRQKRQATPIRLPTSRKCRLKSARRFWTASTRT